MYVFDESMKLIEFHAVSGIQALIRNRILLFSRKPSENLVNHDLKLLLTPFESKLTDYDMSTDV